MYDLRVVVEEIRGFCDLPMVVGDYFFVRGGRLEIPAGKHVCIWALQSLMPLLPLKQRELTEPNDWVPETNRMCCPDPNGLVIYRIDQVAAGDNTPPDESAALDAAPDSPARVSSGIRRLLVDETICSGCRACELTCSFSHTGGFGENNSRILVEKDDAKGLDRPVVCRQCGMARCVQACPQGALSKDERHALVVDAAKCVGCQACAKACPFQAIRFTTGRKAPLICDLCGGEPACVKRCVTGALQFGLAGEKEAAGR